MVINITMIMVHELVTGYQGRGISVPLSGCFVSGSMTAIVGDNGSGKSTLLKTIAGLLPPVRGSLSFNLTTRPPISYLPQQAEIDYQFPLTVFDVVSMGCWPNNGLLQSISQTSQKAIWRAITCVGLKAFIQKTIGTLSSGQFKCMLFARLLVQDSPLILLDEPFNGIDKPTCNLLMTVIKQLHYYGRTIIVVLHDHELVMKHFPQTLWLTTERLTWGPSLDVLMSRPNLTS